MATKGSRTKFQSAHPGESPEYANLFTRVVSVKPPDEPLDDIDVSHEESPEDEAGNQVKEYEAGWAEPGEADITVQWIASEIAAARAIKGVSQLFQIVFADHSALRFAGYIKSIGPAVDREKLTTADIKVKASGPATFSATGFEEVSEPA